MINVKREFFEPEENSFANYTNTKRNNNDQTASACSDGGSQRSEQEGGSENQQPHEENYMDSDRCDENETRL